MRCLPFHAAAVLAAVAVVGVEVVRDLGNAPLRRTLANRSEINWTTPATTHQNHSIDALDVLVVLSPTAATARRYVQSAA